MPTAGLLDVQASEIVSEVVEETPQLGEQAVEAVLEEAQAEQQETEMALVDGEVEVETHTKKVSRCCRGCS